MERFNMIYPFTTENISGYMSELDLNDKKIITVTGSTDHILNAILKGARDITTFDINPLTKLYMDLKLSCMERFSFEEFVDICVKLLFHNIDKDIIRELNMPDDSKNFWISHLNDNTIFNTKYYNSDSKMWQNMYLTKENYQVVQNRIKKTEIKFVNQNVCDLIIEDNYDYMFLSNISDYLKYIFPSNQLDNYYALVTKFLKNVKEVYFAYLYDIGNKNPRSVIDNLDRVKEVFKEFEIKKFKSALEGVKKKTEDGVLILRRR